MWHDYHPKMFGTRRWQFVIQVQFSQWWDPCPQVGTVKMSDRINRHRSSHDIDIKPCIDYLFKVTRWKVDFLGTKMRTPMPYSIQGEIKPQNVSGDCLRGLERNEGGFQDGLRRHHLQGWLCTKGEHSLAVFSCILSFFLTYLVFVSWLCTKGQLSLWLYLVLCIALGVG